MLLREGGLTRKYWFGGANLNRREALRECRSRKYTKSCDEYPSATTEQGCFYKMCSAADISAVDNSASGRSCGKFLGRKRLFDGEAFKVEVLG